MTALLPTLPTLAVSAIYCLWFAYQQSLLSRRRLLSERVAYMLWVAAGEID